jgi:MFS family permease
VDRLRRKPILILTDLGRATVLGSIPLAAVFRVLTMQQIYVVVAVAGILTVLFDVAYQSYLPSLVERDQVLEGNSKLALSSSFAEVAGPGLAGILVQLLTAPMAILLDALSFLASALTVWLVRKPEPQVVPTAGWHVREELIAGMLAGVIGLRTTLAVGAAGLLLSSLWLVLSLVRTMRDFPDQENSPIADQILDSSKT